VRLWPRTRSQTREDVFSARVITVRSENRSDRDAERDMDVLVVDPRREGSGGAIERHGPHGVETKADVIVGARGYCPTATRD
jgi:hypothetical protein